MKHLLPVLFLLFAGSLSAQSNKQVQWMFSSRKISDNLYEIHMTATVNGNWHIYSQDSGEGPIPTSFTFTKNPLLNLDGKVKESGRMKKVFEKAFESEVRFYEKTVNFIQVVKLKGNVKTNVAGKVEFMVCSDSQCLPPSIVDFKVNIGG